MYWVGSFSDLVRGKSSIGEEVLGPVRPTLYAQARAMAVARKGDATAPSGSVLCVPEGWKFATRRDGMALAEIPDAAAARFRRVYGYIGAARDEDKMFPNKPGRNLFICGKYPIADSPHHRVW